MPQLVLGLGCAAYGAFRRRPVSCQTKAYEYFRRAAEGGQDGDSLFNAGYCLAAGIGTKMDLARWSLAFFLLSGATQRDSPPLLSLEEFEARCPPIEPESSS